MADLMRHSVQTLVGAGAGAAAAYCAWRLLQGKRNSEGSGCGVALDAMRRKVHGECIYLDWNATSPIFPEVSEAMLPFVGTHFGNPSSGHAFAAPCKKALHTARANVAELVNAKDDEILFTSCGTEADNHAIHIALARGASLEGRAVPHVIASNIEHPAIEKCLQYLEKRGELTVTLVSVDGEGLVSAADVKKALRKETVLVTVMHSNNEVGSVQPIAELGCICAAAVKSGEAPHVLLHTDAAQSVGKVKLDVDALKCDMLTIVGHKFGAPKGVAALYVRGNVQPFPCLLHGGGQESGHRGGTENVLLLAGMGKAAEVVRVEADEIAAHMTEMCELLRVLLFAAFGEANCRVNGPVDPKKRLPNTLSIGIKGVSAPQILASLSSLVAASASAACHAPAVGASIGHESAHTVSAILRAMKVPMEYAQGTLRLSVGRHTTADEIRRAAKHIVGAAKKQLAA